MKRATSSEPGFTLIEMLVAITLLAVMAVIGWRALDTMMRTRERLVSHDARLDAYKVLFGQFQSDCEHLASATLLRASPVEMGAGLLLLVRDRREAGLPAMWQVVAYRLDGGSVLRLAAAPASDRSTIQSDLVRLRQPGAGAMQVMRLVDDADALTARTWVEPGGWQVDTGGVRKALFAAEQTAAALNQAVNATANAAANSGASTPTASTGTADSGTVLPDVAVRAIELDLLARMGQGDTPREYRKVCMTGL